MLSYYIANDFLFVQLPRDLPIRHGSVWPHPCTLHSVTKRIGHDEREVFTGSLWHLSAYSLRQTSSPSYRSFRRTIHVKGQAVLPKVLGGLCAALEASRHRWCVLWAQFREHSLQDVPRLISKRWTSDLPATYFRFPNFWQKRLSL